MLAKTTLEIPKNFSLSYRSHKDQNSHRGIRTRKQKKNNCKEENSSLLPSRNYGESSSLSTLKQSSCSKINKPKPIVSQQENSRKMSPFSPERCKLLSQHQTTSPSKSKRGEKTSSQVSSRNRNTTINSINSKSNPTLHSYQRRDLSTENKKPIGEGLNQGSSSHNALQISKIRKIKDSHCNAYSRKQSPTLLATKDETEPKKPRVQYELILKSSASKERSHANISHDEYFFSRQGSRLNSAKKTTSRAHDIGNIVLKKVCSIRQEGSASKLTINSSRVKYSTDNLRKIKTTTDNKMLKSDFSKIQLKYLIEKKV